MMAGCVDLKVDRGLLDSSFEGYKLSLESLPTYRINIEDGLDEAVLTEDQYSFQHMKAFGIHNHLALDQWSKHAVYYVNRRWEVIKNYEIQSGSNRGTPVFQVPDFDKQHSQKGRHNVSLLFVSSDTALVADGAGKLYVVFTGDRNKDEEWKVHFSWDIEDHHFFSLLHGLYVKEADQHRIECLLIYVTQNMEVAKGDTLFITTLEWLTLTSADKHTWKLTRRRQLQGRSSPDYAIIERNCQGILVASEKPFKMTFDSVKPVVQDISLEDSKKAEPKKRDPAYTWSQTTEDISVQFTVPEGTTKADIEYKLNLNFLKVGLKGHMAMLEGLLHAKVDTEGSTWMLSGRRLEVQLSKKETGTVWPAVIVGDSCGEMVVDPALVAEIHNHLEHLTSDTENPDPDADHEQPFNSQQLEECDTLPEDTSTMQRFDGETHLITHQVNTGSSQWLFNSPVSIDKLPCICLRHDVDGVLWQPQDNYDNKDSPWLHIGTFNALGYVQASKRDKKFASCAPSFSYAAICDCVRHVYIYRQPSSINSSVRNRKTGQSINAVAKQHVISLEGAENIMGLQATDDWLFVSTTKVLYAVNVSDST